MSAIKVAVLPKNCSPLSQRLFLNLLVINLYKYGFQLTINYALCRARWTLRCSIWAKIDGKSEMVKRIGIICNQAEGGSPWKMEDRVSLTKCLIWWTFWWDWNQVYNHTKPFSQSIVSLPRKNAILDQSDDKLRPPTDRWTISNGFRKICINISEAFMFSHQSQRLGRRKWC